MRARSHASLLLLLPLALALGVWLGGGSRATAQSAGARWEYKVEAWTLEDSAAVLRGLTGDELGTVDDMAAALDRTVEPADDPRVQALVQGRLEGRLARLGADGWEVFWIAETRAQVSGVLLPAPCVYARRKAS